MRPNRKEPVSAPFWFQSLIACKARTYIAITRYFSVSGIARGMQHWHNCPANRTEPLQKEGRAVKRPLRRADVAGAWAGLNGAQSRAETSGLGV
jgi:hypothetical protein